MTQAFVIMQIGNAELDDVAAQAIVPAIEGAGLVARRVDKHNEGGLLKSEIIRFIEDAEIIVADLTNERPNCYLEIGYAMGVDKFRNLILTVREDHFLDSANHLPGGPRVHFDLAGYDILGWSPNRLENFRAELERRIRRRLAIVRQSSGVAPGPVWDEDWITAQRGMAGVQLLRVQKRASMELAFALQPPKPEFSLLDLNAATQAAPISTFGWPIAPYLRTEAARPRPRADGIVATIIGQVSASADYWAIRRSGDFYFLGTLFEDKDDESAILFNTRILRVAESLLYCARLYDQLHVDRSSRVHIRIRHTGLNGRTLKSSNPNRQILATGVPIDDNSTTELNVTLQEIESNLVQLVKDVIAPLFLLFDFFVLNDEVYADIVNRFVRGEVS